MTSVGTRLGVEEAPLAGPLHLLVLPARSWRLLVVIGLVALATSSGLSLVLAPRFAASASFIAHAGEEARLPSGLAGLASQFGIRSLEAGSGSPQFYADLMRSRTLLRRMLVTTLPFDGATRQVIDILKVSDKNAARRLERAERDLSARISVTVDRVTQRVDFSVSMPRPETAKAAADTLLALLDRYNRDILRSQASEKRAFLEGQTVQAAESLRAMEAAMAAFLDRNRSFRGSSQLEFEHDRLARAIALRQDLYLAIARDLDEARIQEVDTRPVITIIDDPLVPADRSWPKRTPFVLIWTFIALALAWVGVIIRQLLDLGRGSESADVRRARDVLHGVQQDILQVVGVRRK